MIYKIGKFPQKTREVFSVREGLFSDKINCAAFDKNSRLFVGTDKGLQVIYGGRIEAFPVKLPAGEVSVLYFDNTGTLYAGIENKLYEIKGSRKKLLGEFSAPLVDVKSDENGKLRVLTESTLYTLGDAPGEYEYRIGVPGTASCLALYKDDRVFVGTSDNGMHTLVGKRRHWAELKADDTGMISNRVNALYIDEAYNVWATTDKGVCVYDDKSLWLDHSVVSALPGYGISDIAADENGDKYFASEKALIRLHGG